MRALGASRFRVATLLAIPFAFVAASLAPGAGLAHAGGASSADALFDRGLADMQAGRFDAACPELAQSYKLDPHAGGLFTLAECEGRSGKIASAIADYDDFLDLVAHLPPRDRTKQDERVKVAAEKRAALSRDVPSISVTLDPAVPEGSVIKVDGRAVAAALLHAPLPLDPGDHIVTLEALDGRTSAQHVTLALRDARGVTLTLVTPKSTPDVSPHAVDDGGSSRRTAVYATAGVGAAALVVGAVLGVIVLADKASIDKNCPTSTTCASPSDASSANGTRTLAWASTGAFIGGGVAATAAAVLWFAWPKSASVEPTVGASANGGMVGLTGVW